MDSQERKHLPEHFPKELLNAAYSLLDLGSKEVAWKFEDAIKATQWFAEHDYIILGGDVYYKDNEHFVITYDNWYLTDDEVDRPQNVEDGKRKTLSYIEMYHHRNGDAYYYTLLAVPKGWRPPK